MKHTERSINSEPLATEETTKPTQFAWESLPESYYKANFPVEVVQPYFKEVYMQFKITRTVNNVAKFPGVKQMSEATGLSQKVLAQVLRKEKDQVTIETCDRICYHGDFSLNEMFDDVLEWAEKNPDKNWPDSYLPTGNVKRKNKRKGRAKA